VRHTKETKMAGIDELMAMAQGGGGGGAPMPPPGGGGGMAEALQSKLQELMQDPVAMKGMQQYMQQMGGGMGAPGAAQAPPPMGPMDMPPGNLPPGMEAPAGAPAPEDAEALATQAIDEAGGWEGTEAPTQTDIDRLTSDPSPTNIDSFNQQFGDGAAEAVLEGGGEGDVPEDVPPEAAAEY
jgi:hypothetical protein